MRRDFEQIPTILGYSEEPLTLQAGGGMFGFGGVVLHQPRSTVEGARKVCFDIHEEAGEYPYGVGFQYDKVATVTVSGLLKWTNMVLERAPEGRQDVLDTGPVRIEIFDSKDARKYLDNRKAMFSLLGISFIDYK